MIVETKVNLDIPAAVVDGVVKIRADNPAQQAALESLAERFSLGALSGDEDIVEFDGTELRLNFSFFGLLRSRRAPMTARIEPSAEDLDAVVAEQSIAEATALPAIPSGLSSAEEDAT